MGTVTIGWPLAAIVVILAGSAALVTRFGDLGRWWAPLSAATRAIAQLAVVSLVITFVLRSMWWTAGFLLVMLLVGAGTAARRITGSLRRRSWWTLAPMVAGVAPTLAVILAARVIPIDPLAVLPIAGILIGNAMSATTLAGRRATEELTDRRGSYEAALSLGLTRREAVGLIARRPAALALIPGLDQTRTVGLVTLPGAFVGVLLAGGSPLQAGAAQLLVLVALLLVQAVAVTATVEIVANGLLPVGGGPLPD